MNTKKTIATFFITMIVVCFICLKKQNSGIKNELIFSNIEALAQYEGMEDYICLGMGSLDCAEIVTKVAFIRIF
jgi:hypothetical protein